MFNTLKLYTVHTQAGSDHTLDKPIFLREGFNWFAFLFTFLWAAYHRLWKFAAIILLANAVTVLAMRYGMLDQLSGGVINFAIQIVVGFHGNDCLRASYRKRGFIFQDITSGDSLLRAEQRYFDRITNPARSASGGAGSYGLV